MLVTRQNVEQIRTDANENKAAKGGYIISPSKGERAATIVATGSEVSVAIKAQKLLAEKGIDVAVVSVPCKEVFEEQPASYQRSVIDNKPTIVVEAANLSGWGKYTRGNGDKIGMTSFGTSGPYKELFVHFGFTPEHVAEVVTACVNKSA
jgi:transketolase